MHMSPVRHFAAALFVFLGSTVAAKAQIMPPGGFPVPGGPALPPQADLIAPRGVVLNQAGNQLSLRWTQFSFGPPPSAPANHFEICVTDKSGPCTSTTSRWGLAGRLSLPASSVPRVPIMNGMQIVGYRYTFTLPSGLPQSALDTDLFWKLSSCETSSLDTCSPPVFAHFWMSTKELHALNISHVLSSPTQLYVMGEAENRGTGQVDYVKSNIQAWQAEHDGLGHCITDVNAFAELPRYQIVTDKGEMLEIESLPYRADGTVDVGDRTVVAIVYGYNWLAYNSTEVYLAPNSADIVARHPRVPITSVPMALALRFRVDDGNWIVEADESDNGLAVCIVLQESAVPTRATETHR
jgi:hypothetical protein